MSGYNRALVAPASGSSSKKKIINKQQHGKKNLSSNERWRYKKKETPLCVYSWKRGDGQTKENERVIQRPDPSGRVRWWKVLVRNPRPLVLCRSPTVSPMPNYSKDRRTKSRDTGGPACVLFIQLLPLSCRQQVIFISIYLLLFLFNWIYIEKTVVYGALKENETATNDVDLEKKEMDENGGKLWTEFQGRSDVNLTRLDS